MRSKYSFWKRNSLSLALLSCFLLFWAGQALTGLEEYNREAAEAGRPKVSLGTYLQTGHFISATFENWESEFFQMIVYVLFTIHLHQQGSAESNPIEEKKEPAPKAGPNAPWPVRKGGWWLVLYQCSLTLAYVVLFLISFGLHAYGSYKDYLAEQAEKRQPPEPLSDYLTGSRFWFESFQNWQSEFLAVLSIVVLTIYLRQKGSPESKPVDAPHHQTGD